MGLLDDLKQQADSLNQRDMSSQERRSANSKIEHAKLKEVFQTLTDLAKSLNAIKPRVERNFYVESTTKLSNLIQTEYSVRDERKTVDFVDYIQQVIFQFRSCGTQNVVLEKHSPETIKRTRDYLWGYKMKFECKEIKNERHLVERAVFTIMSEVPGAATFTGDWDSGKIRLTLSNIETLGNIDFIYDPPEINQGLLEELAKLLLGKPNNLRAMGNYQESMMTNPRSRTLK
jgi:hypothetical protein